MNHAVRLAMSSLLLFEIAGFENANEVFGVRFYLELKLKDSNEKNGDELSANLDCLDIEGKSYLELEAHIA